MNAETLRLRNHMKIHKVEINVPVIDFMYIYVWTMKKIYIRVYTLIYTMLLYYIYIRM